MGFPVDGHGRRTIGDLKLAVDALLNPSIKNHYDERGLNTGGPGPYLPATAASSTQSP